MLRRLHFSKHVSAILLIEAVVLVLFLSLPLFFGEFWVVFFTRILILSLLAISFDLVWGYAGVLSFGQALFFGVGAYVGAVVARDLNILSIFAVLPLATIAGFLMAVLIAWVLLVGRNLPSLIFCALGTLTGSYAAERLALGWNYLGGQNGIPGIKAMTIGDYVLYEGVEFYYLALGILVSIYLLCRWLARSQFGLVLAGIRQQEERITFFGYRAQHFKVAIFSLSGAIAGLGGGMFAFHDGFVSPNLVGVLLSTKAVIYVLFGGVGSLIGAVIGVSAIEFLTLELADYAPGIWPIVLGLILLALIVFRPSGLVGIFVTERERIGSFGKRPIKTDK